MIQRSCDVVVVGSGGAGALAAGELARAGARVVVVEAGPHTLDEHVRNADPTEAGLDAFAAYLGENLVAHGWAAAPPAGLPGFSGIHAVGGMLNVWTSNCPAPDASELAPWIGAAEWDALLERARRALHVDATLERGGVRLGRLLERVAEELGELPAGRRVEPMPRAGRR